MWVSMSIYLLNGVDSGFFYDQVPSILAGLFLVGSTPISAGPAVILFRPKKKKTRASL